MDGNNCELCAEKGGAVLWADEFCRVVSVADADYPGFCRVVHHRHVTEMTDLPAAERRHLMDVVFATEFALRELLQPDKVNLASLGNQTPHLHWHVIPRWRDDRHFPQPVWGSVQRDPTRSRSDPDPIRLSSMISASLSRERSGDL